jgi:sugar phosphate isomerase/epimerase
MPYSLGKTRREFLRDAALMAAGAAAVGGAARQTAAAETPERHGLARMKLSCAAYSYRRFLAGPEKNMDLDGFVEACAAAGFDGVELTAYYFPDPITDEYLHHIKRKCYLLGLDISGTGHRNDFCRPPGPERDRDIAHVKAWIDYAAIMGAPYCRIFAGGVPKDATYEQALAWCIECIEQVSEYGGKRGVMVGLETHGGLTSTAEQTLRIVGGVKSDWFGLNLDIANLRAEDPYAEAEKLARHAIAVHLKTEVNPAGKSKQPMDFRRVIGIFRAINYRGYLTLEYEANEDPREAVPRCAKVLQGLLQQPNA